MKNESAGSVILAERIISEKLKSTWGRNAFQLTQGGAAL
jgi:hypothetical protein